MNIVFRCNHCETINELPNEFRYRLCRKCGTIVTYVQGESIICEEDNYNYDDFTKEFSLSLELAEKFFLIAESQTDLVSSIIQKHEDKSSKLLDIPAASLPDTILLLLKENTTETFDELVRNCQLFDISLKKLEQTIKRMKNEGMVYHPKGWLIRLI